MKKSKTQFSIYRDKSRNGIYYIYYYPEHSSDNSKRKRLRKSLHTSDYNEAFLRALKLFNVENKEQINETLVVEQNVLTLGQLRNIILQHVKTNYSHGSYQLYNSTFKYLISELGESKSIESINANDIETFKANRLQHVKQPTVNCHLRKIKASFNYAIKHDLIKISPAKNTIFLREPERERKVYSKDELCKLLEMSKGSIIESLVIFGIYTGCRLSELCNLEWSDIDLKENTITIRNKRDFTTKTGKIRQIPINNKLVVHIKTMDNKDGYIFSHSDNRRFSKDFGSRNFRRLVRLAGLPSYLNFHCLRHTFITNLIRQGVSIYLVKELAGHSDLKTTLGYTHIVTEDLRDAVNVL